jgi:transposase-like protein
MVALLLDLAAELEFTMVTSSPVSQIHSVLCPFPVLLVLLVMTAITVLLHSIDALHIDRGESSMLKSDLDLSSFSCPNPPCKDFNVTGLNNIGTRGTYGPEKRPMLYCRTCGKRFAATFGTAVYGSHLDPRVIYDIIHHAAEGVGVRATARLLHMDKDTVNDVILRVGHHCAISLDKLLQSLRLNEVQLDELWAFVKKKNVMRLLKRDSKTFILRTRKTAKKH